MAIFNTRGHKSMSDKWNHPQEQSVATSSEVHVFFCFYYEDH